RRCHAGPRAFPPARVPHQQAGAAVRPRGSLKVGSEAMSRVMKPLFVLSMLALGGIVGPPAASAQGRCMTTFGSPACNTTDIAPVFAPTGWKTIALDQITFQVADYRKEAAFYIAAMGWTLRRDDRTQAVMDLGDWGTVIFRQMPTGSTSAA